MSLANLLTDTKVVRVMNAVAAGVTQQISSNVNMAGYDGVLFVALLNTVVDGCVLSLQAQDSATAGGTYANSGAGTGTFTAASSSNKMLMLDVVSGGPLLPFCQCLLNRTTQNATIDGMVAILYRAKTKPTPIDASVILSALNEPTS